MNLSRLSSRELQTQAHNVESQLKKLAHRPRPTPAERELAAHLKKVRLTLKDHLTPK